MAGVRGDFKGFNALVSFLLRLTTPNFRQGLFTAAAEAAREQINEEFATETDPWGRRWRPSLRAELEHGQTLSDTGRLRRSFTYRVTDNGFVVGTSVFYAATHQYGATIVPRRKRYLRFRLAGGNRPRKGGRGRVVFAKRVVIPARPFIPEPNISPRWMAIIKRAAWRYVLGRLWPFKRA